MSEVTKVVLVTGASSGIGEAVATRLAEEGHLVVAGARREDRLAALADKHDNLRVRHLDVTDRQSVTAFVGGAVDEFGRVDVFVNNAGVMPLSRLDALLVDEWEQMLDVNVRGLLYGIAATLPVFTRQGSGHLVTVTSVGAHEVVPTSAVYSATKHAAWAVTEGLRLEADPSLRVTTITPGVVESELAHSISDPVARDAMKEYRKDSIPPDAIARAISYAIEQPEDVDVNEIIIRPTRQRG